MATRKAQGSQAEGPEYQGPGRGAKRMPRSETAKRALEYAVLRRLAAGVKKTAISKELAIPEAWVTRIENEANQGFKKLSSEALEVARGREVALLEFMQEETLKAFEVSKAQRVVTVVEGRPDGMDEQGKPKSKPTKIVKTIEDRPPDVKCIDTMVRIRERASKVLGLDQPVELRHVHQRYNEGRELLLQALTETVDKFQATGVIPRDVATRILEGVADRIEELESESTIGKELATNGVPE